MSSVELQAFSKLRSSLHKRIFISNKVSMASWLVAVSLNLSAFLNRVSIKAVNRLDFSAAFMASPY
jgi:hypothetical protein